MSYIDDYLVHMRMKDPLVILTPTNVSILSEDINSTMRIRYDTILNVDFYNSINNKVKRDFEKDIIWKMSNVDYSEIMIYFMDKLRILREYKIPTYGELLQLKLQVKRLYSMYSDIVIFFGNMKIESNVDDEFRHNHLDTYTDIIQNRIFNFMFLNQNKTLDINDINLICKQGD